MKRYVFLVLAIVMVIAFNMVLAVAGDEPEPVELTALRDRTTKVYAIGEDKYAMDISIGSVHYQDESNDWQEINTAIVPSDKPNWDYEVIKGHWHLLINDDTGVALGKGGNWIGFRYEGFGYLDWATKDYVILGTRDSVSPTVDDNSIMWTNLFSGVNLEYIYGPDGFKENLYVTQNARDWLITHPPSSYGLDNQTTYLVGGLVCDWQFTTFTPALADGTPINWDMAQEFLNDGVYWRNPATNKTVTALPIGTAYVEGGEPDDYVDLRYRFYKDGETHYLLFGANVLDLNALPAGTIVIDPTVDEQVGASNCDAYQRETGTMYLGGDYAYIYSHSSSAASRYWGGFRWTSESFPAQSSTITSCYIELYASSVYDDMNSNIHFEELEAPAVFTTDAGDITNRDITENSVSWVEDSTGGGWVGSAYDLTTPLQEVIDAYSPTAIVAVYRPNQDANKSFRCWQYDGVTTWAAKLHIEYTGGAVEGYPYSWGQVIG